MPAERLPNDIEFDRIARDTEAQLLSYPGKASLEIRKSIALDAIAKATDILGPTAVVSCDVVGY